MKVNNMPNLKYPWHVNLVFPFFKKVAATMITFCIILFYVYNLYIFAPNSKFQSLTDSPSQTVGPMPWVLTLSSLDNSFNDSVSTLIIGNQSMNFYGGPEPSDISASDILCMEFPSSPHCSSFMLQGMTWLEQILISLLTNAIHCLSFIFSFWTMRDLITNWISWNSLTMITGTDG